MKAYKLFRITKDGEIASLFINRKARYPTGVWLESEDHPTVGCMRRFACRNFQITTTVDSKLSYTPCYNQYGKVELKYQTKTFKNVWWIISF